MKNPQRQGFEFFRFEVRTSRATDLSRLNQTTLQSLNSDKSNEDGRCFRCWPTKMLLPDGLDLCFVVRKVQNQDPATSLFENRNIGYFYGLNLILRILH